MDGLSTLGQNGPPGRSNMPREFTWFLAPYINSYKRFQVGTFAPTKIIWSEDNRTAGFRLCGEGTKAVRMECRIGGADLNPYLAFAALIAAGLAGIDEKLELQKPFVGDAYQASRAARNPEDAARRDRNAGEVEDAAAPRSATTSSTTTSTPPTGSSSNTTAASPTGSCTGVLRGTKVTDKVVRHKYYKLYYVERLSHGDCQMGKYAPLRIHLLAQASGSAVPMTFDEIERMLGEKLPASKKYPRLVEQQSEQQSR